MEIEDLKDVGQPWVVKIIVNILLLVENLRQHFSDKNIFVLNGLNMKTYDGLYDEFTKVFRLPDYFGRNLDALDECLNDLEWLDISGIIIVISNSNLVLCEEKDSGCGTIIEVFESAGVEWSRPVEHGEPWDRDPVTFHAIMQVEKEGVRAIDDLQELII